MWKVRVTPRPSKSLVLLRLLSWAWLVQELVTFVAAVVSTGSSNCAEGAAKTMLKPDLTKNVKSHAPWCEVAENEKSETAQCDCGFDE